MKDLQWVLDIIKFIKIPVVEIFCLASSWKFAVCLSSYYFAVTDTVIYGVWRYVVFGHTWKYLFYSAIANTTNSYWPSSIVKSTHFQAVFTLICLPKLNEDDKALKPAVQIPQFNKHSQGLLLSKNIKASIESKKSVTLDWWASQTRRHWSGAVLMGQKGHAPQSEVWPPLAPKWNFWLV